MRISVVAVIHYGRRSGITVWILFRHLRHKADFLELLVHSRENGLELVRKLINHAITFYSGGQAFGENAIKITYPDGNQRDFPWIQSYNWSRDLGSGPSLVVSILMALEAWAHGRIEAGEAFETVLAAVLEHANSAASYLLVAVDLLLSHWPKSRTAAIPFLACPELLCLDRRRVASDSFEMPDPFGLKALQKEPIGLANLNGLKGRPSRQTTLDQVLGQYAMDEPNRATLVELLQRAASRLGPPQKTSTLGDPEFMVVHALNLVDPNNWHEISVPTEEGSVEGWKYESPTVEREHLKTLQDAASLRHADSAMENRIRAALNDESQSSPDFVAAAVQWAQNASPISDDDEYGSKQRMRQEVIATAAMIAARDGSPELIAKQDSWIREAFLNALSSKNDPVHRMRAGLQFNPIGIAFVGMILLLRNRFDLADVQIILGAAGSGNPAAAHGFASALLAEVDERLPRAVLRCALAAAIQPRQDWRRSEEEFALHVVHHQQQVAAIVQAELAWLNGNQDEPSWPQFPSEQPHPRRPFRSQKTQAEESFEQPPEPDVYTDNQAAGLWLAHLAPMFETAARPWFYDIVNSYSAWTWVANGAGLDQDEDVDHIPREWNEAFFKLLAHCLPGLTLTEAGRIAINPLLTLPDKSLFDAITLFLKDVDIVYFNHRTLEGMQWVQIRSVLARRIIGPSIWKYHIRNRSKSVETHFGTGNRGNSVQRLRTFSAYKMLSVSGSY